MNTRQVIQKLLCILWAMLLLSGTHSLAQEYEGHINYNASLFYAFPEQSLGVAAKKTSATEPLPLPFFEDFTNSGVFPDQTRWTNYQVYVNNRMCSRPVSRGVATFDALDWRGIPYDSFNNGNFRYADSLTSQPINLSLNVVAPGDSVYLSFFYQPQGTGFFPLPQDSLMLFLKTRFGGYVKVWSVAGSALLPFRQVLIPITDSIYFDSFFQFTFINKAALYWADAVWNVDYIKLEAGRNLYDTLINDIGFTTDPSFLLNDYTFMPYRQFFANPAAERSSQYVCSLRNNYLTSENISTAYTGTAQPLGTLLKPAVYSAATIGAGATQQLTYPPYISVIPISSIGYYDKLSFQNRYFIQSVNVNDPKGNDTVVREQIFDNYLAYDDGSAEKSYYLSLYPTLPGRIATEYHLNKPDSMQGMAIYFGRQVPFAFNKGFDIHVYSSLAGVHGMPADVLLYRREFCQPGYADTINNFWIYKFDEPLPLPAGTFYAGIFLPAESGSDSLYIGLDVNRVGSNHTWYNVTSEWKPSQVGGALMMRPLLGLPVTGSSVPQEPAAAKRWEMYPNPAKDVLTIYHPGDAPATCIITDIQGRVVINQQQIRQSANIQIDRLLPGIYFVRLVSGDMVYATKKLIIE
jgi:hypothetical protein